jgi:hypothetical protein
VTYLYENELRSLSYLHNIFRNTSRILEDLQFPLINEIIMMSNVSPTVAILLPPDGHCQTDEMGREALPGSPSGNRQIV